MKEKSTLRKVANDYLTHTKQEKAITLIALVITIIVLLILAAVSIATLTGENGILKQARDAKKKTERSEVIERAQIEIFGVQADNNGNLTKAQFIGVLKKFFLDATIPTENDLPDDMATATQTVTAKEEYGSHIIGISEIWNGKFIGGEISFDPETLTIGEAINTDKYGYQVKNYTVTTNEFTTGVWRLFYQDSNYTYLITDELVQSQINERYESYSNGASVSTIGQKLNPKISSLFNDANELVGIRKTAWLTDTSYWEPYANEDAVFAIGSPTVELYAASYNNTGKSFNITLGVNEFGYTYTSGPMFPDENFYEIYGKGSTWWLSSPYATGESIACFAISSKGYPSDWPVFNEMADYTSQKVRPLVCIPTSVFNDKYLSSLETSGPSREVVDSSTTVCLPLFVEYEDYDGSFSYEGVVFNYACTPLENGNPLPNGYAGDNGEIVLEDRVW